MRPCVWAHITGQALEHISPQAVVLTSGGSDIVEAFLREARPSPPHPT
jgi:translation initiation factor 2B subunit (eIF-2B alpha/beta/delta family)